MPMNPAILRTIFVWFFGRPYSQFNLAKHFTLLKKQCELVEDDQQLAYDEIEENTTYYFLFKWFCLKTFF
jgi:hypothetical protein